MILCSFDDYETVSKTKAGRYLVRISFDKKWRNTACFYLSEKQYKNLQKSYSNICNSKIKGSLIAVFDGARFVWSGEEYRDHSDREWLKKTFNAVEADKFEINEDIIIHNPEIVTVVNVEPNKELLKDELA